MSEMCCTRLAEIQDGEKSPQKSSSVHHRTTLPGYIFATKARIDNRKNLLNSSRLQMYAPQYGELRPTNGQDRLGHPSKFQRGSRVGFITMQRRCSTEVNQTLHDVWPSAELVYYMYIFGSSCPLTEFCQVQHSLCVQVLCSPVLAALAYCTALEHQTQCRLCQGLPPYHVAS